MTRVYVLAEGQTEEAFCTNVLTPHFQPLKLYLTPIVVSTSPGYRGGVVSYAKIKPQITRLCRQDSQAVVTTMFDLYALPADFPGKNAANAPQDVPGAQKAEFLENALAQDIGTLNFLPNLLVHELEALLFTRPSVFAQWSSNPWLVDTLTADLHRFASPEDINDSPSTAPSKRILAAMPQYQKTFHGPLIACDIGLDAMRQACPHFQRWLLKLEALAGD
jgi:Domain of unknown function (DUF4276)